MRQPLLIFAFCSPQNGLPHYSNTGRATTLLKYGSVKILLTIWYINIEFVSIKRKIFTDAEYRDFARTLDQARRIRQLSVTDAATVLGITRQMLHLYLNCSGHQPRWRVIERACRSWDVSFVAQGKRWDKSAFGRERLPAVARQAVQLLLLPEAIERLENANFEIEILKKEPSRICLELRVKFSG
jgi:hypothetical protein